MEKTGKAMGQMKRLEKTRLLLNEKLPVQADTKFRLANPTIETENQGNNCGELLLNRQQLANKHVNPTQFLEKEKMYSKLKDHWRQ